ncbi:peptidoglycan glycosyltransferase [Janibacter hoylei PVAS-1]|uniref:Peptidoglycan glycosyltransferase n=1 Tax=Janibacter hoylei PVAS-1 TaxID=1210046 RepID=K1E922_9MICO|nr:peptidoglycan glycosyltransferase [Janibacter hoylei PVAS-1]
MSDSPRSRAEARSRRRSSSRRSSARPKRGKRRILRKVLIGLTALVALGIGAVVAAYLLIDIPKPNDHAVSQASVIYYSDGKTEMDRIAKVNREAVELDRVPEHVQHAFLAAEDRSFYENRGISPKGIFRAVSGALAGEDRGGGSTITQQYVKNYFLTQDQTLERKGREILLSVKIDGELSKDEILTNYLNTIYFGRGADGIQTASKAYFNKDVEDLTPSEGALLASVIRGPSLYDPALGEEQTELATSRWNYVLDGMVDQGWMTASERAEQKFPKTKAPKRSQAKSDDIGFITEEVRSELRNRLELSDADIDRGGFKIVTTIDKDAQAAAVKAVKEHRPTGRRTADLHIGLASVQPGDGGDPGHVRRREVRPRQVRLLQLGRGRQDAGRLDDEALHDDRGPAQGHPAVHDVQRREPVLQPGLRLLRLRRHADPAGRWHRQLRQLVVRPGQHAHGDPEVGQHLLRAAQPRGHPEVDRRVRQGRRRHRVAG